MAVPGRIAVAALEGKSPRILACTPIAEARDVKDPRVPLALKGDQIETADTVIAVIAGDHALETAVTVPSSLGRPKWHMS